MRGADQLYEKNRTVENASFGWKNEENRCCRYAGDYLQFQTFNNYLLWQKRKIDIAGNGNHNHISKAG